MNQVHDNQHKERTEIQWSKYAEHYDQICEVNPSYSEMINLVVNNALSRDLPRQAQVLDVGAGTGNLIAELARQKTDWNFVHLDYDQGMNSKARAKYASLGLKNVSILERSAEDSEFRAGSFDLILTTNAIYAIPGYAALLENIKNWLAESGTLIAVDFGRPQNTNDWIVYIAKNLLKEKGLTTAFKVLRENWEVARQNRRTSEAQGEGNYWVHNNSEFRIALEKAGFNVERNSECYRGYSDLAVCSKAQK